MSDINEEQKRQYKRAEENDIKLLKEELEKLREDNYVYHQLMRIQNKREYRSKFLKEFQEEFGKNVFPDYDEIYKRYDKLKKENERLNNIIDELEKTLKEEVKDLYNEENPMLLDETYIKYATERKMAYMYILDKLNELKGDNK